MYRGPTFTPQSSTSITGLHWHRNPPPVSWAYFDTANLHQYHRPTLTPPLSTSISQAYGHRDPPQVSWPTLTPRSTTSITGLHWHRNPPPVYRRPTLRLQPWHRNLDTAILHQYRWPTPGTISLHQYRRPTNWHYSITMLSLHFTYSFHSVQWCQRVTHWAYLIFLCTALLRCVFNFYSSVLVSGLLFGVEMVFYALMFLNGLFLIEFFIFIGLPRGRWQFQLRLEVNTRCVYWDKRQNGVLDTSLRAVLISRLKVI